jgi:hypothetical protein
MRKAGRLELVGVINNMTELEKEIAVTQEIMKRI